MAIKNRTTSSFSRRLAAAPAPKPDPEADARKIATIAQVLGVDASDPQAMMDALSALLQPAAQADAQARRKMSPREIEMCKQKKVSPAKYIKAREELNARRAGASR